MRKYLYLKGLKTLMCFSVFNISTIFIIINHYKLLIINKLYKLNSLYFPYNQDISLINSWYYATLRLLRSFGYITLFKMYNLIDYLFRFKEYKLYLKLNIIADSDCHKPHPMLIIINFRYIIFQYLYLDLIISYIYTLSQHPEGC